MASGVMGKVAFVGKVPTLMKATSDDMKPTPGYLFNDIAKITYESLDFCEFMVDFLLERLKKKSLQVKLKVLIVIKHVLEKGHEEFAKCLRKRSDPITACKDIHGPSDPMYGDKYYVDIRNTVNEKGTSQNVGVKNQTSTIVQQCFASEEAIVDLICGVLQEKGTSQDVGVKNQEVSSLLFNLDRQPAPTPISNMSEQQSFGSNQRMEGFGNTTTSSSTGLFQSVVGKIKEAVPTGLLSSTTPSDNRQHHQQQHHEQASSYKKYEDSERKVINRPSDILWGTSTSNIQNTMHNNTGLATKDQSLSSGISWHGSLPPPSANSHISKPPSDMNWLVSTSQQQSNLLPSSQKPELDFHEVERRIIEEITVPQGMRHQPSKQELDRFTKKCSSLDHEFIVDSLYTKIQEVDTRVQLRTLCVLESLLTSDIPNINTLIKNKFSQTFQSLQKTSHSQTRNKAQKLLKLLEPSSSPPIVLGSGTTYTSSNASKTNSSSPADFDFLGSQPNHQKDSFNLIGQISTPSTPSTQTLTPLAPVGAVTSSATQSEDLFGNFQDFGVQRNPTNNTLGKTPERSAPLLDMTPDDLSTSIDAFSFDMPPEPPKSPYSSQVTPHKKTPVQQPQASNSKKLEANFLDLDAFTSAWQEQVEERNQRQLVQPSLDKPTKQHDAGFAQSPSFQGTGFSPMPEPTQTQFGNTSPQQNKLQTNSSTKQQLLDFTNFSGLLTASLPAPPNSYHQRSHQQSSPQQAPISGPVKETVIANDDTFFSDFDQAKSRTNNSSQLAATPQVTNPSGRDEVDLFAGLNVSSPPVTRDTNTRQPTFDKAPLLHDVTKSPKSNDFGGFVTPNNNGGSNQNNQSSTQSNLNDLSSLSMNPNNGLNSQQFSQFGGNQSTMGPPQSFNPNSHYSNQGSQQFVNTRPLRSGNYGNNMNYGNQQQQQQQQQQYGMTNPYYMQQQQQQQQRIPNPYYMQQQQPRQQQQMNFLQNQQFQSGHMVQNQSGSMSFQNQGGSSFDFLTESPASKQQGKSLDAFSFVQDAMKTSTRSKK